MLLPRQHVLYYGLACLFAFFFLYVGFSNRRSVSSSISSSLDASAALLTEPHAANSTLGFGAIYAVSGADAIDRRSLLIQAANVTELEIRVPQLPKWTEDDDVAFNEGLDPKLSRGTTFAWKSHEFVLKQFLEDSAETALILEDDVDWDIHLRTKQIPRAAAYFRNLFHSSTSPSKYYYGELDNWDVLFLGHCGDYFDSLLDKPFPGVGYITPADLNKIRHIKFKDDTMPETWNLHPFTVLKHAALGIPDKTRVIHQTVRALCTFGYAIQQTAAKRLLDTMDPREDRAFDLALLRACNETVLRCWTLSPELMHHKMVPSLIGINDENDKYPPPVDERGMPQVRLRNESSNIECGFYSGDFNFGDDMVRLDYLRREVGGKGNCLKDWKREKV